MPERLFKFREAAELCNVKLHTLRAWRRRGKIAVVRVADSRRCLRIPEGELRKLITVEIGTSSPGPAQP